MENIHCNNACDKRDIQIYRENSYSPKLSWKANQNNQDEFFSSITLVKY